MPWLRTMIMEPVWRLRGFCPSATAFYAICFVAVPDICVLCKRNYARVVRLCCRCPILGAQLVPLCLLPVRSAAFPRWKLRSNFGLALARGSTKRASRLATARGRSLCVGRIGWVDSYRQSPETCDAIHYRIRK